MKGGSAKVRPARATVVSVRLDDEAVGNVDLLVRAGLATSRSEAAAHLVNLGIGAARDLLEKSRHMVDEIETIRDDLFRAVRSRDKDRLRDLISADPSLLRAVSPEGETPVLTAVYDRAMDLVEVLLSQGGDLDIFEAAAVGDRDLVAKLLDEDPALLGSHSGDGWTALHLAAHFGHLALVKDLVKRGALGGTRSTNKLRNTPLNAAVFGNRPEVIRFLLESRTDVNVKQQGGWTPLHRAAYLGYDETVTLLLEHGANPQITTDDGETALQLALKRGHRATADLIRLTVKGSNPTKMGETASMATLETLLDAVAAGDRTQVKEVLAQDPTLLDGHREDGMGPILMAAYYGKADILEDLLQRHPSLNIFEAVTVGARERVRDLIVSRPDEIREFSPDGWTPLHLAAFFGRVDIMGDLLRQGADMTSVSRNHNGNRPIHAAAANRRTEACALLLDHGDDVNGQAAGGWTPLHLAAGNGDEPLARLLLDRGAEPTIRKDDGLTPSETASAEGHEGLARILEKGLPR